MAASMREPGPWWAQWPCPGERVVDIGCGCGTNGVCAGRSSGPVSFVDSNLRATVLAEHNARKNGLTSFEVVASTQVDGLSENSFDVALANPPYFAQAVDRRVVHRSGPGPATARRAIVPGHAPAARGGHDPRKRLRRCRGGGQGRLHHLQHPAVLTIKFGSG